MGVHCGLAKINGIHAQGLVSMSGKMGLLHGCL